MAPVSPVYSRCRVSFVRKRESERRLPAVALSSCPMGARICPGCATRVDERRAKTSPYCLRCGAPLGPPAPMDGGRSSTFASKQPGAGGSSPLPWILGAIGLVVLLGVGAVIALIAVVASNADPDPPVAATAANQPKVEAPPTTAVSTTAGSPTSTIAVKTPAPTFRPSPTTAPTRTATAPTPPPFPTPTPTGTNGGSSGALAAFNRTKAQDDVDRVAAGLGSCKQSSGPFGAGSIRIDFEPDGRVGTLSRPPFAGTAVGSCISARFLAIRLGPFSGSTQNIEKAFIIQQ